MLQKLTDAQRLKSRARAAGFLHFAGPWVGRFRYEKWRLRQALSGRSWRKFHLISELARIHGYRSVLEISTARSGYTYDRLDQSRFDVCRRLSYLTPDDWTDGAPVDYRCSDRDTSECLRQIRGQGLGFDIVFVDACHEYDSTCRDMEDALSLLNPNGVVVLHDCLPNDESHCTLSRGDLVGWFGVTYKAYLDALLARKDLWYCTVDTDFGCGMVRLTQKTPLYRRAIDGDEICIREWRNVGDNYHAAYQLYERNRANLMNVVTVKDFLMAERQNRMGKAAFAP